MLGIHFYSQFVSSRPRNGSAGPLRSKETFLKTQAGFIKEDQWPRGLKLLEVSLPKFYSSHQGRFIHFVTDLEISRAAWIGEIFLKDQADIIKEDRWAGWDQVLPGFQPEYYSIPQGRFMHLATGNNQEVLLCYFCKLHSGNK
jgi:hypothetical protein